MTALNRVVRPLCAAIGLLALGCTAASAQSGRTFTLRLNHVLAPTEPHHQGYQA